jgi:hypothetical protein
MAGRARPHPTVNSTKITNERACFIALDYRAKRLETQQ